jgi:rubrerythrin
MTEASFLALIAMISGVTTGFFKLLHDNTIAQRDTTRAMNALVDETRKGNREAAERNGHLGEQSENIVQMIAKHNKDVEKMRGDFMKTVTNVNEQHVVHQTVEKEIVENQGKRR